MSDQPETTQKRAPRFRMSIAAALMISFAGLMALGIGIVMAILGWTATENTRTLIGDKSSLTISLIEAELHQLLDPVAEANRFLSQRIEKGEIDPNDVQRLAGQMLAAMAATPQALGMGFIPADLKRVVRVSRQRRDLGLRVSDERTNPAMQNAVLRSAKHEGAHWGELITTDITDADLINKSVLINFRTPILRDGRSIGLLTSVVSVSDLSQRVVEGNTQASLVRFVLYGEGHVLAHKTMMAGSFDREGALPIPALSQIDDIALRRIWDKEGRRPFLAKLPPFTQGHTVEIDDETYVYFYRRLNGFPGLPLTIGAYLTGSSEQGIEVRRLAIAGVAGLVVLVLAVIVSLIVARRLSHSVGDLAKAAQRIGGLELEKVPTLGRSRLRDLDDAAGAFNTMISTLRWFETYVPRKLVRQLMAGGAGSVVLPEERDVTVMFTDIVGFTTVAQRLSAEETAALLNDHFSLLADCIENEDGTLDKYIGDSVMAFWGPPLGDHHHARRACRAALAIRTAIEADNARRAAMDVPPIRIRVGIHTGPAIVGNVGAPGRMNYTLVGDSVNIAQRLEQLIKALDVPASDVGIVVSGAVASALGGTHGVDGHPLVSVGAHELAGRQGKLEVFVLG